MAAHVPRKEQLTVAAAVAFVLSVGVMGTLPSVGHVSTPILVLSGLSFVALYASG